jgi:ring-1,2-phenylacetyl-CoA epoxidase subunit PaaD
MVTPEQEAVADAVHAARGERPSWTLVWSALAEVPDPEIPNVSVLDLGIVRSVEWDPMSPGLLVVRVTPTYTGCPATDLIAAGIRDALADLGVVGARIETVLAPAWSTDWLGPLARQKLRDAGIAPPGTRERGSATIDVRGLAPWRRVEAGTSALTCPRCGSASTELVSQFGSTACKAQYRCRDCLEPFDHFKRL